MTNRIKIIISIFIILVTWFSISFSLPIISSFLPFLTNENAIIYQVLSIDLTTLVLRFAIWFTFLMCLKIIVIAISSLFLNLGKVWKEEINRGEILKALATLLDRIIFFLIPTLTLAGTLDADHFNLATTIISFTALFIFVLKKQSK